MKVLIACEFSGIVREEFKKLGHDAWSIDLLHTEKVGQHYRGDIRLLADIHTYDLMIAHPPCTYLCVSGARWFSDPIRQIKQKEALEFVKFLLNVPINKIALENPVGIISSKIRKPDQIIHPWQFGEFENKKTCLWLKNLPKLKPTDIIKKVWRDFSIHKATPGTERWKERSRTFQGIAEAMAKQWGDLG
jgi:site-specific DNA-cytosine methylase